MANEIEKVNTIEITDIEKFNGKTDDNIEKLNSLEFVGVVNPLFAGTRGVVGGGEDEGTKLNIIQYKTIASDANTSDFGDLNYYAFGMAGAGSNITRGIFTGGSRASSAGGSSSDSNDADYITVGSTGNGTDFGNLNDAARQGFPGGGSSNGTLLFVAGGFQYSGSLTSLNRMEYFTIASTGNGTDAGNLSEAKWAMAGTHGNTRYLAYTGYNGTAVLNTIEYNDFSTSANVSDFGDASTASYTGSSVESTTRAVFTLGQPALGKSNIIEYVTVASTGNVTDFGDLTAVRSHTSGYTDGTRGEFAGGEEQDGHAQPDVNKIEKITIASTGDASDVGDLLTDGQYFSALSGT